MGSRTRRNFARAAAGLDAVLPLPFRGPAATAGFLAAAAEADTTEARAAYFGIWALGGLVELAIAARKRKSKRARGLD